MAEALLKSALRDVGDFTVESAGLGALVGYPADDNVLELMAEINEDVSNHRARQIHPDMVKEAYSSRFTSRSSTRRFVALPSADVLSAIG